MLLCLLLLLFVESFVVKSCGLFRVIVKAISAAFVNLDPA